MCHASFAHFRLGFLSCVCAAAWAVHVAIKAERKAALYTPSIHACSVASSALVVRFAINLVTELYARLELLARQAESAVLQPIAS